MGTRGKGVRRNVIYCWRQVGAPANPAMRIAVRPAAHCLRPAAMRAEAVIGCAAAPGAPVSVPAPCPHLLPPAPRPSPQVMDLGPKAAAGGAQSESESGPGSLGWAALAGCGGDVVVLASRQGQLLALRAGDVRVQGRAARGVKVRGCGQGRGQGGSVRTAGDTGAGRSMRPAVGLLGGPLCGALAGHCP